MISTHTSASNKSDIPSKLKDDTILLWPLCEGAKLMFSALASAWGLYVNPD